MSVLLKEIKRINPSAGDKLERLDFRTDSDLRSLTREDLQELFPGENYLRMRKTIFETIHKHKPIGLLLNEIKDFIPDESLRAAISDSGVLAEYLHILKDMKAQMDSVQTFLDAHISLLENINTTQHDKKPDEGGFEVIKDYGQGYKPTTGPQLGSSSSWAPMETQNSRPEDPPQRSQYGSAATSRATAGGSQLSVNPTGGSPQPARKTIKCNLEIGGNTLNAHLQILDKVQNQDSSVSLNLVKSSASNSDITLLFCPISSRAGTDIERAMKIVEGDERVILVEMRHSREVKYAPASRTWSDFPQIVLHVTVFYHDAVNGLLECQENTDAIAEIRKELLKHSYEAAGDSVVAKRGSHLEIYPSEPDCNFQRSNSQKKTAFSFSSYLWKKNYYQ